MKNFYIKVRDYHTLNNYPTMDVFLKITEFFMSLFNNNGDCISVTYIFNQSIENRICPTVFFLTDDMSITEQNLQNVTFTTDLFIHKSTIKNLPNTLRVNGIVWADNLDYYPKHLIVKPLDSLPRKAI